jgi:hypothetical protein
MASGAKNQNMVLCCIICSIARKKIYALYPKNSHVASANHLIIDDRGSPRIAEKNGISLTSRRGVIEDESFGGLA